MTVLSNDGKVISGEIVNFINGDESDYPQLTRLYLEFDFRVIEVTKIDNQVQPAHRFLMAYKGLGGSSERAVTPAFRTLSELERHAEENVIDILQRTVFETTFIAAK